MKKNRESKLQIIKEILRLYHLFCLLIYFFVSGRKAKYMKNQINRCIKKNQTEGHNKQSKSEYKSLFKFFLFSNFHLQSIQP